jgi:hypothetical protein
MQLITTLVIEIGANIGAYSLFLDALIKSRPDSRLKRVIAFEPALGPFGRLLDNLKVNETHFVLPIPSGNREYHGLSFILRAQGPSNQWLSGRTVC